MSGALTRLVHAGATVGHKINQLEAAIASDRERRDAGAVAGRRVIWAVVIGNQQIPSVRRGRQVHGSDATSLCDVLWAPAGRKWQDRVLINQCNKDAIWTAATTGLQPHRQASSRVRCDLHGSQLS